MLKWEHIGEEDYRARVVDGWLIRSVINMVKYMSYEERNRNRGAPMLQVTTVFVPDKDNKWDRLKTLNHPNPPFSL